MEKVATSGHVSGGAASSFADRIKRVMAGIFAFTDLDGYKTEMARYEKELQNRGG